MEAIRRRASAALHALIAQNADDSPPMSQVASLLGFVDALERDPLAARAILAHPSQHLSRTSAWGSVPSRVVDDALAAHFDLMRVLRGDVAEDVACISGQIRDLLGDYTENPFRWIREADFQSDLARRIEASLEKKSTPVKFTRFRTAAEAPRHQFSSGAAGAATGRVHLEIKVLAGDDKAAPTDNRADIVVLRSDGAVRFWVSDFGAFDVVQQIEASGVLAVIEVKASPSTASGEPAAYVQDLLKMLRILERLPSGTPRPWMGFVLIDKAIDLPSGVTARKKGKTPVSWFASGRATREAKADAMGRAELSRLRESQAQPSGPCVHGFEIDADGRVVNRWWSFEPLARNP